MGQSTMNASKCTKCGGNQIGGLYQGLCNNCHPGISLLIKEAAKASEIFTQDELEAATAEDIYTKAESQYGSYYCRKCIDRNVVEQARERHSMSIYAGMLCDKCWEADGRNHAREFDQMDAGESYEDDY